MQTSMRQHSIGNRRIFVVDGLFDQPFILMLHHFMSRLQFGLSGYDTVETKHLLHWAHEFDLKNLPSLPIIPEFVSRIVALAAELFPSSKLQLQRFHCNVQPYGDVQNPHIDAIPRGTAVYFANARWGTEKIGRASWRGT